MMHRIQSVFRTIVSVTLALVVLGVSATFGLVILGIVTALFIVALSVAAFTRRGERTPYMYQCHIFEHEDCGMMDQSSVARVI